MLTLSNQELGVSVLDPVQDRVRLGSRYCVGGYVYEVTDHRKGVITSGPGYPSEEYPPVFDGQGLPEAFRDPLWEGADPSQPESLPPAGTTVFVIGVGLARITPNIREMPVLEFADWKIEQTTGRVTMATHQEFAGWALDLTRELVLVNRTLISRTRLANVGHKPLSFRWFPHPFFPNPRGESCKFNIPVSFPENPGYELLENGFVQLKADGPWNRQGCFQLLDFQPEAPLVTLQRHPLLGLVVATCSYVPSLLPIWGNANTFSFEPYAQQAVAPGGAAAWWVAYDF